MNTRQDDLNHLEQGGARETLLRVYRQSKDEELERGRRLLMDANRNYSEAIRTKNQMLIQKYEDQINKLEAEIRQYSRKYER